MIDARNASTPPAPAIHWPSVSVWAEKFMTYASARTAATVTVAHLSWFSVFP
jgi:hypothetical protein